MKIHNNININLVILTKDEYTNIGSRKYFTDQQRKIIHEADIVVCNNNMIKNRLR